MFDRRPLQQLHGGEPDARLRLAFEQMQHDRNRGSRRADEKERRQKRQHHEARVTATRKRETTKPRRRGFRISWFRCFVVSCLFITLVPLWTDTTAAPAPADTWC